MKRIGYSVKTKYKEEYERRERKFKEGSLEDRDGGFRRAQVAQKYRGILCCTLIG